MKKPPGFASWPLHLQQAWLKSQAARPSQAPARPAAAPQPSAKAESDQQDQAEEAEEPTAEIDEPVYIQYRAKKIRGARPHPDAIVETGSLGSVEPPDPTYNHHLEDIVNAGLISDAQLETVVYANMRFRTEIAPGVKSGFFLGDGAGVGKGRQIAAMILDHWRAGGAQRVLWVSVSNDLRYDAVRDLEDIKAANIGVYPREKDALPKGNLAKLAPKGVIFITYSLLISGAKTKSQDTIQANNDIRDLSHEHYPKTSRLRQLVDWLQADQNGRKNTMVVFDESHKAKNLLIDKGGKRSHTAEAVLRLQNALPQAHVLYSSATGASTPMNLAYMVRLGMAGFPTMDDMIKDLKKSGLGALELYSMALKATGSYVSRTLSYSGAEFNLVNVNMDAVHRIMYDRSSRFVCLLFKILDEMGTKRTARAQFWGAVQRFFRTLLIAAKVPVTAKVALQHVQEGMCVVIGLQSTGEAGSNAAREVQGNESDDLISAPRIAMRHFIESKFPVISKHSQGELSTLEYQVRQVMQAWSQEADAKSTAAAGTYGPSRPVAARMRTSVKVEQASRGGTASRPQPPGRIANTARPSSSDGDNEEPELMQEKGLDEVLEDRRLQAMQAGQFLDLTDAPSESARAAMEQEVKAEEAQEAAGVMQEQANAVVENRKTDLEEALEDLKTAKAEIDRALGCTDVRALGRMRRLAESELISLEKAAAAAKPQEAAEEGRNGRRRRRAAPTNLVEQDPSPRPLQKRRGSNIEELSEMSTDGSDSESDADFLDSDDEQIKLVRGSGAVQATTSVQTIASRRSARPRQAASQTVIVDLSSDESEDEIMSPVRRKAAGSRQPPSVSDEPLAEKPGLVQVKPEPNAAQNAEPMQAEPIVIEDDQPCQVCGSADDGSSMLLCDGPGCDKGYHMGCLTPPLTAIPDGDWLCPGCSTPAAEVDDVPQRARSRKASQPGMTRLRKTQPDQPSPDAENRDPACHPAKSSSAAASQQEDKLQKEIKLTVSALERRAKAAEIVVEACRSAMTRAEKRAANPSEALSPSSDEPAEPRHRAQRQRSRAGGSGSTPAQHSGKHIELSDAEGDAAAALPNYRHAVKQKAWANEDEESESDDDVGMYGYTYEEDEDGNMTTPDPHLKRIRKMLLRILDSLELPPNPLDHLIELLGGEDKVAEMTGRKGGFVRQEDNTVQYQQRRSEEARDMVNIKEKESFMRGKKLIAIISEAASVGISLQADRRVQNKRRRCHMTLELPWSADKAIQQFGRSHRSNQESAPLYRILVTTCGGEHRFASSAAKRLQSLGALLKGDRRALGAGADLKEFDIDNKYGLQAVQRCLAVITGSQSLMEGVQVPRLPAHMHDPNGASPEYQFYDYMKLSLSGVGLLQKRNTRSGGVDYHMDPKAGEKVPFFLNRLMVMPTYDQELMFTFFSSTLEAIIQVAKSKKQYDAGIQNMNANYSNVKVVKRDIVYTEPTTGGQVFSTHLAADRGLSWEAALARFNEEQGRLQDMGADVTRSASGFYILRSRAEQGQTGHPLVILAAEIKKAGRHDSREVKVYRANNHIGSIFQERSISAGYKKATTSEAQIHWEFWFNFLERGCCHGHVCAAKKRGQPCFHGNRMVPAFVLSGAVLPLLSRVYGIVERSGHGRSGDDKRKPPPRVIKVTLGTGEVLVGMSLIREDMDLVKADLLPKPLPAPAVPPPA